MPMATRLIIHAYGLGSLLLQGDGAQPVTGEGTAMNWLNLCHKCCHKCCHNLCHKPLSLHPSGG
ncbi:protein of unknown function [Pseudomonas sp. JV551A1]|uniref:Uncharacterized protein n=1 Tax=Pseudomonas inefficax TaxID=2078786 RepID=A0AAQ1SUZ4_9PSED|nr:protein of unknown function [Pseudomonas sp. JV551A1]SPO62580.1 protein of unknown function [Pseudomonas inefficax]